MIDFDKMTKQELFATLLEELHRLEFYIGASWHDSDNTKGKTLLHNGSV